MDVTDKTLDICFNILREDNVPYNLSQRIMNHIYVEKDLEKEISIQVNRMRFALVAGMALLIFTLTTFSSQQESGKVVVAYHDYSPMNYSERIALSKEKITESTIFCMITEN
ncbi:MAG: hypothetical protein DKM50_14140 [Candidatus Margulisiibacteriota bacterium]|nr:MAG: hypothetical protein A2X43_09275 [Candidatus Margulisbacteria bacterium GWD2_39_127]OGI05382.1 MAG: hypothetical protein A2X42_04175 [Candidatus Margulisbacteria bacterium GWF2_38_17]OGI09066.1 MAG: hypothetical protein A2X41_00880 [Candidatus Margulisbacteria bacterium GWE2_39_32]PZM77013.1 MAG: hypothetical protein DKM50_14140 [Candidatus Margulisiibacteriota bacterium]HAR64067.1 hypothetical protein [Candidatus Margulisiibacteriota bacterium]